MLRKLLMGAGLACLVFCAACSSPNEEGTCVKGSVCGEDFTERECRDFGGRFYTDRKCEDIM